MKASFFAPSSRRALLAGLGVALAVVSVLAPMAPLGPLSTSPPMPLAVVWLAYGYALKTEGVTWRAPALIAVLGVAHDLVLAHPPGLFAILYLSTFFIGGFAAQATQAPWIGMAATGAAVTAIASLLGPFAFGADFLLWPFALAMALTVAIFPVVRPLYFDDGDA